MEPLLSCIAWWVFFGIYPTQCLAPAHSVQECRRTPAGGRTGLIIGNLTWTFLLEPVSTTGRAGLVDNNQLVSLVTLRTVGNILCVT